MWFHPSISLFLITNMCCCLSSCLNVRNHTVEMVANTPIPNIAHNISDYLHHHLWVLFSFLCLSCLCCVILTISVYLFRNQIDHKQPFQKSRAVIMLSLILFLILYIGYSLLCYFCIDQERDRFRNWLKYLIFTLHFIF